jgi:subtilisin family serine protease
LFLFVANFFSQALHVTAPHSLFHLNDTSLSIQGRKSSVLNKAILGLTELGIHVISAAGNMGTDACKFSPASAVTSETSVISVGALDQEDKLVDFSNYGDCVSILGPGKDVPSVFSGELQGI